MALLGQRPTESAFFREVPPAFSGIHWVHENGMSPGKYLPETLGPGCAFLDYDNDGWMDIYLVNSGPSDFFHPRHPIRNALYKNNRDGTFTDVTESAGVPGGTFGMGVAVGDFNNDGYPDIFVTACGRSLLYRNNGDGTFTDVTVKAGLEINGWTTSAVWCDFDNDGRLDLFVCSFVRYLPEDRQSCGDNAAGQKYYCIPRAFHPTASYLFHNNGDGTFTEVGKGTVISKNFGKALGVVATDINNDGHMDLFVTNDTVQNFLFVNRGANRWEEISIPAEVAFSENGQARSGMGVDAADLSNRGWQDLFVANIDQEKFALYRNLTNETFEDVAASQSIAQATRLLSGWGLHFFDYDNDGELDLILANGHPDDMVAKRSQTVTYREPLLLFQQKNGKFHNVSADAGPAFAKDFSARGLAVGDFDNDGDMDAVVNCVNAVPQLLRCDSTLNRSWIKIRVVGTKSNRTGIGAKIKVVAQTGTPVLTAKPDTALTQIEEVRSCNGYYSASDLRIHFGLGEAKKVDVVEIRWPSGHTQTIDSPDIGKLHRITEPK